MVLMEDSLCIRLLAVFPVHYGFFLSFVQRAVSYTVAEDEWIFSSLLRIFSCVSWSTFIQ